MILRNEMQILTFFHDEHSFFIQRFRDVSAKSSFIVSLRLVLGIIGSPVVLFMYSIFIYNSNSVLVPTV